MKLVFSCLKKGWVVTLLLSFFVLNSFYYDVLFAPNKHVFNPSGDGLKNYYTAAYFIKNNQSLTSFEGMNYPYGESVMYTDGHPALSYILKTLSILIPDVDTNVIGILNTVMLLSILLTSFIIYHIFKQLNFHDYFASFSAVGLTYLSPQIFRLQGHYSLSYGFAIPLTILLIILVSKNKKTLPTLSFLAINNIIWFFTHPYLGLMTSGMTALYAIFSFTPKGVVSFNDSWKQKMLLGLSGTLPILLFLSFSSIIDHHEFRPTNPHGINEYHATFESVFLPNRAPFKQNVEQFYKYDGTSWEGVSYIGIVSLIILTLFFFRSVKQSFEQSKIIFFNNWLDNHVLKKMILCSIVFLFFSMLLPFRWGLEEMVDRFSSIKQFRAIGRFAWVFYYVLGISVLYLINNWITVLLSKHSTKLAYALIIGVPVLYLSEGFAYHKEVGGSISKSDNIFRLKRSPQEIKDAVELLSQNNFQALIPLPFYHVGSDNYGKSGSDKSMKLSMVLSFQTGLPLVSSHLARTSLKETRKSFQLFSENHFKKNISRKLTSELPFLIMHTKEFLVPNEIALLKNASIVKEYDSFILYQIDKKILFRDSKPEEQTRWQTKTNLYSFNNYWVSDTSKFFYHKSFDNPPLQTDTSYLNSSKKAPLKHYNVLLDSKEVSVKRNREYEASVWTYTGDETNYYGQDKFDYRLFLEVQTPEKTDWVKIVSPSESMTIDGAWSQIKFRFWAEEDYNFKIFIHGDQNSNESVIMDEFLFRETGLDIYEKRDDILLKNCQIVVKN